MKKWCLVILALMLCGCSTAPKTAETEAVKYDRPVLRTEAGSNEKKFYSICHGYGDAVSALWRK